MDTKPPASYHDDAETRAAIAVLSPADWNRLLAFALHRTGLQSADAEDLLNEAFTRTLQGNRRWNRDLSIQDHLCACMRSLAHERRAKANRHQEVDLLDTHPAPGAADYALDAAEAVDAIARRLKAERDGVALDVLHTMLQSCSPAEAQFTLGIADNVYWAARKKIRRRFHELFTRRQTRRIPEPERMANER